MGAFPRNHQKQDTKLIWALNFVQKSICSSEELSTVAFECWFLFSCAQACHSSERAFIPRKAAHLCVFVPKAAGPSKSVSIWFPSIDFFAKSQSIAPTTSSAD